MAKMKLRMRRTNRLDYSYSTHTLWNAANCAVFLAAAVLVIIGTQAKTALHGDDNSDMSEGSGGAAIRMSVIIEEGRQHNAAPLIANSADELLLLDELPDDQLHHQPHQHVMHHHQHQKQHHAHSRHHQYHHQTEDNHQRKKGTPPQHAEHSVLFSMTSATVPPPLPSSSPWRQHYRSKFTIEELLHTQFEPRCSNDIDMDPCKAGGFMGDIALPDVQYGAVGHHTDGVPIVGFTRTHPDDEQGTDDDSSSAHTTTVDVVALTKLTKDTETAGELQNDAPVSTSSASDTAKALNSALDTAAGGDDHQPQQFNLTFQQELEKLKQEVYHEGLQVEEEGLTDIIRKKTKLPSLADNRQERLRNEAAILSTNEPVKPNGPLALKNLKNEIFLGPLDPLQQQQEHHQQPQSGQSRKSTPDAEYFVDAKNAPALNAINVDMDTMERHKANEVRVFNGGELRPLPDMVFDSTNNDEVARKEANKSAAIRLDNRNVDQRRIQSNTKDIELDTGNNFIVDRKVVVVVPTSPPTALRSTLPNVYSNAGGNGMKLDDVEFLHSDGVVRRRHRRGRKNRRSSEAPYEYAVKVQRLREELDRPMRTAYDFHRPERNQKQQQQQEKHSLQHHQKHENNSIGQSHNKTGNQHYHHDHQKHRNHHHLHQPEVEEQQQRRRVSSALQTASTNFNYSAEVANEMEILMRHQTTMDNNNSNSNNSSRGIVDAATIDTDAAIIEDELEFEQDTHIAAAARAEGYEMDLHDEVEDDAKSHHRSARAVTAKKERVWDYGVIPYEIDGNFSGLHKALFKQAMRHWENFTCIKFVERDPEIHPNYIVFTVRSCGCCSFVGKRGNGPQAISIGRNCDKFGIVVHELGHVVGFWHEHTRPDRENHVLIEKNNIMKGQDYNFNKLTPDEVDSLGLPYDYDSIMHYARNTFSKGTYLDTILPIDVKGKKRPEIGQRLRLSAGDIAQANLLYKCPKCGRTFQESSGVIFSPSFYTAGALTNETEHCEWRITATHGERVVLRLENLNILKSEDCKTDYLEVRDGYYVKSPLIGRFCGKVSEELITSESSRMLLTYVNTHRVDGHRGFKALYEVICGGELSVDDAEGRLESPNYPLEYLPNKECVWKITVPKGFQVALKFQSFEVENHDSCVYDYVEVRDGPSQESPLIGLFCGYKAPPNMKSRGNTMFVKFMSDTSVQKAGFSAIFMKEVDECETQNHGCEHECINTLGGYECSCHIGYELHSDKKHCEDACGGVIEYPNGTITSPSFPDTYPLQKDCIWEIIAPPKHKISLNFTHFDLEGSTHQNTDCGYDSVTIYSKLSEGRTKPIGTYCGGLIPPTATSEGNALRVEFHSDKSVQHSGFAAVFFTDVDECSINNGGCQHECRNTIGSYMCSCHNGYSLHENGHDCKEGECKHEISASYGPIYSPNFPDDYPPNADCVWHFSTTPGHRIKLIFNEFNIESHQECAYDNVAIFDGESESSSLLGRFCGDKIPYPISSSTNQLYMVLKTDKNKQRTGFSAMHSTSCGGYLRATSQIKQFYSHARFGNHDYDENMDCEWTIQASASSNVQLLFLTFDLETSDNCTYDYVQVYSGMEDTSGPMYGQYCGNTLPQDIISLTDSLLVRFKTDSSVTMKGFSASYVAVDPFDNSDEDLNSYSSETIDVTPFPGSLKSIYKEDDSEETVEYGDLSENQLMGVNSPYFRVQQRFYNRY